MLKKVVEYEGFDGEKCTAVLYFNLTKTELIEMELSDENGSLGESLQNAVKADSKKAMIKLFKDFVLKGYGIRDGDAFRKSEKISEEFSHTMAYDTLLMELLTNEKAAAEFMTQIIPKDLLSQLDSGLIKSLELPSPETKQAVPAAYQKPEPEDDRPAWIREDREPTSKELMTMDANQLREVYKRKAQSR